MLRPTVVILLLLTLALAPMAHGALINLGAAGVYAGAAINGQLQFTVSSGGTNVWGDVFVGHDTKTPDLDFTGGGDIFGTIYRDPAATINISGGSQATGGVQVLTVAQSNQITTDLDAALLQVSALTPTQTFGNISGNTSIAGNGGLNVLDMTGINLQGGSTLTLNGGANDFYVIRVSGNIVTGGNSIISSDGMGAGQMLFVVNSDITMSGGIRMDGTYVSRNGDITLSDGTHNGAYIIRGLGKDLKFQSAPQVHFVPLVQPATVVPEPATVSALGMGLLGLMGSGITRRRRQRH